MSEYIVAAARAPRGEPANSQLADCALIGLDTMYWTCCTSSDAG